jgi:hypothetical protein
MPDRPDEFDEAWARIVEELTAGQADAEAPARGRADREDPRPPPLGGDAAADRPGEPPEATDSAAPAGLAALFEPLRRAATPEEATPGAQGQDDPGAFVDNWSDEGHFTPPPPPELPVGTPVKRLAWAALPLGPTTWAAAALTGWDLPPIVGWGAGLATLAGFVTLVWQMPESREDGWDDGARL